MFIHFGKVLTSRVKQTPAVARFQDEVTRIAKDTALQRRVETDLVKYTIDMMFSASRLALFGKHCPLPLDEYIHHFVRFDDAFPLLAANQLPWLAQRYLIKTTREGIVSRDFLARKFGDWSFHPDPETGEVCKGLAEGDIVFELAKDLIRISEDRRANGEVEWDAKEVGHAQIAVYWAL